MLGVKQHDILCGCFWWMFELCSCSVAPFKNWWIAFVLILWLVIQVHSGSFSLSLLFCELFTAFLEDRFALWWDLWIVSAHFEFVLSPKHIVISYLFADLLRLWLFVLFDELELLDIWVLDLSLPAQGWLFLLERTHSIIHALRRSYRRLLYSLMWTTLETWILCTLDGWFLHCDSCICHKWDVLVLVVVYQAVSFM